MFHQQNRYQSPDFPKLKESPFQINQTKPTSQFQAQNTNYFQNQTSSSSQDQSHLNFSVDSGFNPQQSRSHNHSFQTVQNSQNDSYRFTLNPQRTIQNPPSNSNFNQKQEKNDNPGWNFYNLAKQIEDIQIGEPSTRENSFAQKGTFENSARFSWDSNPGNCLQNPNQSQQPTVSGFLLNFEDDPADDPNDNNQFSFKPDQEDINLAQMNSPAYEEQKSIFEKIAEEQEEQDPETAFFKQECQPQPQSQPQPFPKKNLFQQAQNPNFGGYDSIQFTTQEQNHSFYYQQQTPSINPIEENDSLCFQSHDKIDFSQIQQQQNQPMKEEEEPQFTFNFHQKEQLQKQQSLPVFNNNNYCNNNNNYNFNNDNNNHNPFNNNVNQNQNVNIYSQQNNLFRSNSFAQNSLFQKNNNIFSKSQDFNNLNNNNYTDENDSNGIKIQVNGETKYIRIEKKQPLLQKKYEDSPQKPQRSSHLQTQLRASRRRNFQVNVERKKEEEELKAEKLKKIEDNQEKLRIKIIRSNQVFKAKPLPSFYHKRK